MWPLTAKVPYTHWRVHKCGPWHGTSSAASRNRLSASTSTSGSQDSRLHDTSTSGSTPLTSQGRCGHWPATSDPQRREIRHASNYVPEQPRIGAPTPLTTHGRSQHCGCNGWASIQVIHTSPHRHNALTLALSPGRPLAAPPDRAQAQASEDLRFLITTRAPAPCSAAASCSGPEHATSGRMTQKKAASTTSPTSQKKAASTAGRMTQKRQSVDSSPTEMKREKGPRQHQAE